jgi:hypothetical protein
MPGFSSPRISQRKRRLCYDIDGGRYRDFEEFTRRGYVFVQVNVHGRGRSGGVKSDNLGLQVSSESLKSREPERVVCFVKIRT